MWTGIYKYAVLLSEQSLEQSWAGLLSCLSSAVLVFVLVNLTSLISSEVLAKLPSGNFILWRSETNKQKKVWLLSWKCWWALDLTMFKLYEDHKKTFFEHFTDNSKGDWMRDAWTKKTLKWEIFWYSVLPVFIPFKLNVWIHIMKSFCYLLLCEILLFLHRLVKGDPAAFLPIISYCFTSFSTGIAELLVKCDVELTAKSDLRFIEAVYKVSLHVLCK